MVSISRRCCIREHLQGIIHSTESSQLWETGHITPNFKKGGIFWKLDTVPVKPMQLYLNC